MACYLSIDFWKEFVYSNLSVVPGCSYSLYMYVLPFYDRINEWTQISVFVKYSKLDPLCVWKAVFVICSKQHVLFAFCACSILLCVQIPYKRINMFVDCETTERLLCYNSTTFESSFLEPSKSTDILQGLWTSIQNTK